ncbi:MAG: hypothetical protein ACTHN0_18035 [Aquihabitans sp.]
MGGRYHPAITTDEPTTSAGAGRRTIAAGLFEVSGAIAVGAFSCSVLADVVSFRADDQFIYAQAAYLLVCVGLVTGVVAAVLGATVIAREPRGTFRFRAQVRLMLADDAVLAWFAVAYLVRRDVSMVPVSYALVIGSAAAAALALAARFWGVIRAVRPAG